MRDTTIFQTRLEERLKELLGGLSRSELAESTERAGLMLREVVDTKDMAFRAAAAELRELGLQHEARELADIRDALGRITAGTYGLCIECRETIPEERLVAWPTAKRCRPCQEMHEKRTGSVEVT
jgi:RNA polymerase-binding transcription factor DksA